MTGVLEIHSADGIGDDDDVSTESVASKISGKPVKSNGQILWSDPIVTELTRSGVTHLGQIIKPPERLTYAPAVELQYLGEMAIKSSSQPCTCHSGAWNLH